MVGRRPLASQVSLAFAFASRSRQGRLHLAESDSPRTKLADHRPHSANTASSARIATSFLRCWSELSKLFAAGSSPAWSPTILLAVDDQTTRSAAGMPKATAGTDCGSCKAAGGTISDCELRPDVLCFRTTAAAASNDAGLKDTASVATGVAVVTLVSLDVALDEGSRLNAPPAPIVRLPPSGRAWQR